MVLIEMRSDLGSAVKEQGSGEKFEDQSERCSRAAQAQDGGRPTLAGAAIAAILIREAAPLENANTRIGQFNIIEGFRVVVERPLDLLGHTGLAVFAFIITLHIPTAAGDDVDCGLRIGIAGRAQDVDPAGVTEGKFLVPPRRSERRHRLTSLAVPDSAERAFRDGREFLLARVRAPRSWLKHVVQVALSLNVALLGQELPKSRCARSLAASGFLLEVSVVAATGWRH
jgi:hypothetical protein